MSDTPTTSLPAPAAPPSDRAEFWRATRAEFARSGLSVRAFCRQQGLHEKRFFTWRRNLGLSPVARPTPTTPAGRPNSAPAVPGFVPVRVVPDTSAEVSLPGGVTVRVPVHADPGAVARLVAALAGGRA